MGLLTGIDLFLDDSWYSARVHSSRVLRLQGRAILVAWAVERTLERVVLPSKDIVTVVSIASARRNAVSRQLDHR